jgi:hypothetical protein
MRLTGGDTNHGRPVSAGTRWMRTIPIKARTPQGVFMIQISVRRPHMQSIIR